MAASLVRATSAVAVTPHDSTNIVGTCIGLYIGGTGNVVLVTRGGDAITFSAVPAGTIIPCDCKRVNATSTTATAIVALLA